VILGDCITSRGLVECEPATGFVDFSNRAQLEMLIHRLRTILEARVDLDNATTDLNEKLINWHETLKECESKYNFTDFVNRSLELPEDHPNLELVNRVIDMVDCLNKAETALPVVKRNKIKEYMQ
jgi:hypothetical protein